MERKVNVENELEDRNVSLVLVEKAKSLSVNNTADFESAGIFKKQLEGHLAAWVERFEELRVLTKAAYDKVLSDKRIACTPIEDAIKTVKEALNAYATRCENERRAAQAKADAEARAKAEAERQALLDRAAEAKTTKKQDELLERAELVYEKPVIVEREIPKTIHVGDSRITQRSGTEVVLVDMKVLCGEIVAGRVPITVVEVKQKVLNEWVKSAGIKACPGLQIRPKVTVI